MRSTRAGNTALSERSPKVVQILYSGLGGQGTVAFSLQEAAGKAWSDRFLFVGIEPLLSEYEGICRREGISYRYVAVRAGRPWLSWRKLYAALAEDRPDAILLHSVKTVLPCRLYAWLHGTSLIAVEHQQNVLKKPSEWIVSRLLMVLADRVVVLTEEYRNQLEQRLKRSFRNDKVSIIPNGINVLEFSPRSKAKPVNSNTKTIGMASRFTPNKRQETLVDALIALRNRDVGIDWRLSLAGDGECLGAVRRKVEQAGLGDVVDLPGYLGHQELADWFGEIDIYAHASDGETLSTALLQAMAAGVPIVGSDVPGIDNLLSSHGGCGLLAAEGTADSFAAAFERLARDGSLAEEIAGRARDVAVRNFSHQAMFAGYDRLLASTCGKSSI